MNSVRSVLLAALTLGAYATAATPSSDVWRIDTGPIDPKVYFGATLANGMLGITSAAVPLRTGQILINGAYETLRPGYVSALVSTFNFLDVALSIDGERIEQLTQVRDFRQQLDLKKAVLTTSFNLQEKATVTYTLRALRHMPHSALLEIAVTAKRPLTIESQSLLGMPQALGPHADPVQSLINVQRFDITVDEYTTPKNPLQVHAAVAKSQYGRHTIAAAHGFMFTEPLAAAPTVTRSEGGLKFARRLAAGETYRHALVGSSVTSAHAQDPLNEAQRVTSYAALQGAQRLVLQHERHWQALWRSDILIEGDAKTQREVHSMLYHLYASIREDAGYSIAPMGLSRSSTGYLGHIYWDADVWMLPALVALKPALAKAMVEYRYARLPAAKRKAAALGYRGALFPWESAESGEEETPSADLTGSLQHHVTAGVALGAWNYYRVTQDREWLREKGYPLIKETADFWASRVERNGPGRYEITHVIGPDEYARNVDNNAFTNAAAKENLALATRAALVLGLKPDPDWAHVRENIPILKFPNGVTRQHATYNGEKTKIADVNLLAYPLQEIVDAQAIRRDLEYYTARIDTVHGPAMAHSMYAILYQRLGMPERAYKTFKAGYAPNLRPPFGVLAEQASGNNPYLVTAAGGFLQTVLFGFGGLKMTDEGLVQVPSTLPAAWKSLTLTGIGIGPEQKTFIVKGAP